MKHCQSIYALMVCISPDSPFSLYSHCLAVFSFYFYFFPLTANCDWLIKTITEITKSNQVADISHVQTGRKGERSGRGGTGTRPNTAEQIRLKTEQLQAEMIF